MDEALIKLVFYILYGIFLGIKWLVIAMYRGVRWIVRWIGDQGSTAAQPGRSPPPAPRSAPSRPVAPATGGLASVKLERALTDLVAGAEEQAARCAIEEQNERFVDTFSRYIAGRARTAATRVKRETPAAIREAEWVVAELSFVRDVVTEMAEQRRDEDKLLLLGDADALAEACYRPLFEFARGSGTRLTSSRAATFLGDKDLAIFTGFIPTGLAPIILPSAWAAEIGWWPALAHEIGHDFHASVEGFDVELRKRSGLPAKGALPRANAGFGRVDLDAAFASWIEEIFADVFGTLMLGAAYVTTMSWSFANSKDPGSVVVVQPAGASGAWTAYDEHPPAHLRVVLSCRLLAAIGFPREAELLEDEWRKRHGSPQALLVPTQARGWYQINEAHYLAYGEQIVNTIYLAPFSSLSGYALRSIPGLDLGPREHQAALDARDAYLAGREAETRDPRCLIAGAVLAWKDRPALSARVLRAARATIPSVGVSRRQLRLRAARDLGAAGSLDPSALDAALWREAFLLGEALAPPRGSKLPRRL